MPREALMLASLRSIRDWRCMSQWMRSTSVSRSAIPSRRRMSMSEAVWKKSESILLTSRYSRRMFFWGTISPMSMRSRMDMRHSSSSTISMPIEVWVNFDIDSSIVPLRGLAERTEMLRKPAM